MPEYVESGAINGEAVLGDQSYGRYPGKLEDAKNTLLYADKYMAELGKTIDYLNQQKLSDRQVLEYIDSMFPLLLNPSEQQVKKYYAYERGYESEVF